MLNKIKQAFGMSGDGDEIIGSICTFAGRFAPENYVDCNGQLMTVHGNEALFSIINNMYGGDGKTNFAVPDLRPFANDGQTDTGHHRKVDWIEVNMPRQVICIRGIYPVRP